ncbi:MAG: hypothetical protein A2017_04445 [Lentisphaerae bacterium GWF2_44_16]|nr:MAG: hypothetical protein A2017_04445 [Lentisphaerae bacterium GWF2_44_16]
MKNHICWDFPLPRTHTGIMMGNGTTGLLIWGEGPLLKITMGRADLWDHRGGMQWTEKHNYRDIRKCLENNDENGIKKIFASRTENIPGKPRRPSVVPLGRLDISLGEGAVLKKGSLCIGNGKVMITYEKNGTEKEISIQISMKKQIFLVEFPEKGFSIKNVPSWEMKKDYLSSISFEAPVLLENGWIQKLPEDPPVSVTWKLDDFNLWALTERGDSVSPEKLENTAKDGKENFSKDISAWWKKYWKDIPKISLPNEKLEFIYNYGLYKFASFTSPDGVPATLQGAWIEDYEMPPWSSDYHFNINIQMCYWPAYKANRLNHLMPLFKMVWSWRDKLRHNAKMFIGIDDGYMLPHAVDDRCTCMGSFWTGCIDHACAAWIAQMMFSYYKYTGDMDFLSEIAFPFMKGVMRVYEEMLEKDGDEYILPVSVSPEYRGAKMNAWGRNASFQLAAIHRLCEDLMEASDILNEVPSSAWIDIKAKLPEASLNGTPSPISRDLQFTEGGNDKIALWDGVELEESHRHHSHLAAICPFDSIDIYSEKWMPVISRTINYWVEKGTGGWSGWCVPWASMIHSRLGNADMAEILLEIWLRIFTNEGYGTLHDCSRPGFSIMGGPSFGNIIPARREIMQMDAGMGAVTAVQDMLMHSRRGVIHIFPGVPSHWKSCFFRKMPCEGGFLISAEKKDGQIVCIEIESSFGKSIKLGNPFHGQEISVEFGDGKKEKLRGDIIEINIGKKRKCTLSCK